mmetsp:Transcript_46705/g.91907  ORF Transcript_46705/g.91907 Transcript_46705/m.91907 type:complete len:261 (+) Transcript_46705:844-1626(+)
MKGLFWQTTVVRYWLAPTATEAQVIRALSAMAVRAVALLTTTQDAKLRKMSLRPLASKAWRISPLVLRLLLPALRVHEARARATNSGSQASSGSAVTTTTKISVSTRATCKISSSYPDSSKNRRKPLKHLRPLPKKTCEPAKKTETKPRIMMQGLTAIAPKTVIGQSPTNKFQNEPPALLNKAATIVLVLDLSAKNTPATKAPASIGPLQHHLLALIKRLMFRNQSASQRFHLQRCCLCQMATCLWAVTVVMVVSQAPTS